MELRAEKRQNKYEMRIANYRLEFNELHAVIQIIPARIIPMRNGNIWAVSTQVGEKPYFSVRGADMERRKNLSGLPACLHQILG